MRSTSVLILLLSFIFANSLDFINTAKKKYYYLYEKLKKYIKLDALNTLSERCCKAIPILDIVNSALTYCLITSRLHMLVEVDVIEVYNILYVHSK